MTDTPGPPGAAGPVADVGDLRARLMAAANVWERVHHHHHGKGALVNRIKTGAAADPVQQDAEAASLLAWGYADALAALIGMAQQVHGDHVAISLAAETDRILSGCDHDWNTDVQHTGARPDLLTELTGLRHSPTGDSPTPQGTGTRPAAGASTPNGMTLDLRRALIHTAVRWDQVADAYSSDLDPADPGTAAERDARAAALAAATFAYAISNILAAVERGHGADTVRPLVLEVITTLAAPAVEGRGAHPTPPKET